MSVVSPSQRQPQREMAGRRASVKLSMVLLSSLLAGYFVTGNSIINLGRKYRQPSLAYHPSDLQEEPEPASTPRRKNSEVSKMQPHKYHALCQACDFQAIPSAKLPSTPKTHIHVLGERHSGTNAMELLLARNFDVEVSSNFTLHKHFMQPYPQWPSDYSRHLLVLTVINPYDWLVAMQRDCYHCEAMEGLPLHQFLTATFQSHEADVDLYTPLRDQQDTSQLEGRLQWRHASGEVQVADEDLGLKGEGGGEEGEDEGEEGDPATYVLSSPASAVGDRERGTAGGDSISASSGSGAVSSNSSSGSSESDTGGSSGGSNGSSEQDSGGMELGRGSGTSSDAVGSVGGINSSGSGGSGFTQRQRRLRASGRIVEGQGQSGVVGGSGPTMYMMRSRRAVRAPPFRSVMDMRRLKICQVLDLALRFSVDLEIVRQEDFLYPHHQIELVRRLHYLYQLPLQPEAHTWNATVDPLVEGRTDGSKEGAGGGQQFPSGIIQPLQIQAKAQLRNRKFKPQRKLKLSLYYKGTVGALPEESRSNVTAINSVLDWQLEQALGYTPIT